MESHKCSGYYSICQNKLISGLQFIFKEDGKEHSYCIRCVAFGVKTGHFDREDILRDAPFLKKLIEAGGSLSDDAFSEKLRNMKPSPIPGDVFNGRNKKR